MDYKELIPSADIAHYVECYWMVETQQDHAPERQISFPDGTIDMVFSFADSYERESLTATGQSFSVQTGALIGMATHGRVITSGSHTELLSIRFKPFGLYPLLGIPMREFSEQSFSLQDVMTLFGRELEHKIFDAPSMEGRIAVIEHFLQERIRRQAGIDKLVRAAVSAILLAKGNIKIDDLYTRLGVSKSTLENKFNQHVGISPKELADIWRFNYAVIQRRHHPQLSLTEIGYESAYYDQSHMIKAFKRYTGVSPKDFFKQQDMMTHILETGARHRFSGQYLPKPSLNHPDQV